MILYMPKTNTNQPWDRVSHVHENQSFMVLSLHCKFISFHLSIWINKYDYNFHKKNPWFAKIFWVLVLNLFRRSVVSYSIFNSFWYFFLLFLRTKSRNRLTRIQRFVQRLPITLGKCRIMHSFWSLQKTLNVEMSDLFCTWNTTSLMKHLNWIGPKVSVTVLNITVILISQLSRQFTVKIELCIHHLRVGRHNSCH